MKDFIMDGKTVRNCYANIAKMNLFEAMVYGHTAPTIDWKHYFMSLGAVLIMPFVLIFYPVIWMWQAISERKKAKRWMEGRK